MDLPSLAAVYISSNATINMFAMINYRQTYVTLSTGRIVFK